jgi:DNA repair ATPase RecN
MSTQTPSTGLFSTATEQVFLSPRVVDKNAFDEFSAALRNLMDSAVRAGQTLETSMAKAEDIARRLPETAPQLDARIESLAARLSSIETRLEQATGRLDHFAGPGIMALGERSADALAAARTLDDSRTQAEATRRALGEAIFQSASLAERLDSKRTPMKARLAQMIEAKPVARKARKPVARAKPVKAAKRAVR